MPYYPVDADSVLPSADAKLVVGVAYEHIETGDIVFFDTGTLQWKLALTADATKGAVIGTLFAMALNEAHAGQPIHLALEDPALTLSGTFAFPAGTEFFVDKTTPGKVHPYNLIATGQYRIFAFTAGDSTMNLKPFTSGAAT